MIIDLKNHLRKSKHTDTEDIAAMDHNGPNIEDSNFNTKVVENSCYVVGRSVAELKDMCDGLHSAIGTAAEADLMAIKKSLDTFEKCYRNLLSMLINAENGVP